jgi:hypothetical protein
MSTFDDAVSAMDAALFDAFKQDDQAVHTSLSSVDTSVDIVLDPENEDLPYDEVGRRNMISRMATIRRTQLDDVELNSIITTDGYTYRIDRIIERDSSILRMELKREKNQKRHAADAYVRND